MTQTSIKDRAIVVGIGLKTDSLVDIKESLVELEELAYAAGSDVVGSAVQVLPAYNPGTLLGSGKVTEIKQMVQEQNASIVIIDHQLTGVQGRNLTQEFGCRVIDRSQLILDIFAQRATTHEGKLQVELALMLDQMPRMIGAWQSSLSRQGGGIGTRGPGETALETDRRRIRDRIKQIKKQLESVTRARAQHRSLRRKQGTPSFALIGYTNTGKSTLINRLTQSQVLVKDQLFATLDPTTRKIFLPEMGPVVITDTVGFIRKLPTHLIEAFKATLEETGEADVLVHVVDLSSQQWQQQQEEVQKLIDGFGWGEKPIIHVYNKIDQAAFEKQFQVKEFPRVFISAKTGEGTEKLKRLMIEAVQALHSQVELYFPKDKEYRIYDLGRETQISRTEAASTGTVCYVNLTQAQMGRWGEFIVKKSV